MMLKFSGAIIWRLGSRSTMTIRRYSTPGATVYKTDKTEASRSISDTSSKLTNIEERENSALRTSGAVSAKYVARNSNIKVYKRALTYAYSQDYRLVAAAFASLNSPESEENRKPSPKSNKPSRVQQLDGQIQKAADVDSLLTVAENAVVSRRHALKMVSVLSEWSSTNRVKISDFEKDPRFLKLCRILARASATQTMSSVTMAEDLSTVLGITGDDEAARLIMNLSLAQMIKVIKALHQKGRRSTPLLRALSHNIAKQTEVIDLKKSADLLFCMAALNFPDPVLLDRICSDIMTSVPSNQDRPAVVNSILVSLGLMRYRHEPCVTSLCEWLTSHGDVCRASDVASAVTTLGTLDFMPPECEELLKVAVTLKEEDMTKSSAWIDLVFSLLVLNKAELRHLESTLKPEFIEKLLSAGEIPIPVRRKLMCIDAYTSLISPRSIRLPEDVTIGVPLLYTKEKAHFVNSIMDTIKSLVSADTFLKKECNSGMGFLYDAEFAVDSKCHPVPLNKASGPGVFRIAVFGLDYHDMTRKTVAPVGINQLYAKLLTLKGFKVLQIPYTEFNPRDKLVTRVQYIEKRLKQLISEKDTSA